MIDPMNSPVIADTSKRLRGFAAPVTTQQRSKRTNRPFAAHDLKTACGRRIADLARAYAAALGNPADIGRQAEIVAAAELQVLAEEARAVALANPAAADLDAIVRSSGRGGSALRRLRIKPAAVPDGRLDLASYLASKRQGSAE